MNVDLNAEEIHALIAWHDNMAETFSGKWIAEDEAYMGQQHTTRADELFFLLSGARRKSQKTRN